MIKALYLNRVRVIFLLAILSLINSGCGFSSFRIEEVVPADERHENISLKEAQELAPFSVCLPSFIPSGAEAIPEITYHADFGDSAESDIRLRYYRLNSQELVIEVYQRHRPGASTPAELAEEVRNYYVRDLLAWEVGWPKTNEIWKRTVYDVTKYQDSDMEGWLFEIIEPVSLQANMIVWGNDPVAYQVYTYLPIEDAKNIVRSVPNVVDCQTAR